MKYGIQFEFNSEGEPPKVYIAENEGNGTCVVQVIEYPTCSTGGKMVETNHGCWDWEGEWSWEDEDWTPGPIATRILDFMNQSPPELPPAVTEGGR